jgi:hypothetical protein
LVLLEEQEEVERLGPAEASRVLKRREQAQANRSAEESVRRARAKVRRLTRTYTLSYMVTLTFPGDGVHVYDRALRLLQDFVHDHGTLLHRGTFWLAVPEPHPGGHGWHWHILVPQRFSKAQLAGLREGWTAFLARRGIEPSGGARYTRIDVKAWGTAADAARYAAKYVGKGLGEGLGKNRRRFLSAQGGQLNVQRCGIESLETLVDVLAAYDDVEVVRVERDDETGRPAIVWAGW